jgi:radical SAM superfamily enzyme YgiQ (UPF0313 family)
VKKLLLINPVPKLTNISKRGFKIQPLSLAYVAAVTPKDWDVKIIDENFCKVTGKEDADIVGITSMTSTVNRGYEIASQFRTRGITVIMGGIHVSMVPEEALNYADSIVIGEAEDVWETVIGDFEKKTLKKIYRASYPEFEHKAVFPRRDLLDAKYKFASIQSSRGCPFGCEFCSVPAFNGKTFRQRTVQDIINEIEQIPQRVIAFIDDNLIGYSPASKGRAEQLFREMRDKKLNKLWGCQASINFVDDEHLLRLAAESGCCVVLIGLESINPKVLEGHMSKKLNASKGIDYYYEVAQKLHKYGIMLIGSMIFCNDEDDLDVLPATLEFISKSDIDIPWPGLSTPNPGTPLYNRLLSEERLLFTHYPDDWDRYISTITFKPKNYDSQVFYDAYIKFIRNLFSNYNILKRSLRTFYYSKSIFKTLITFNFNQSLRRKYEEGYLPPNQLQ